MSIGSITLPEAHHYAPEGLFALLSWIVFISLLLVALIFGGMGYLIIALAFGLAVMVWVRPQEAPAAGMLYLFACSVLFPPSGRFEIIPDSPEEMRYWAVGLLIITASAVARLGLRRVFAVPFPAKVFLAAAFAAAVYGQAHGAATSYVLRQFYGVLLLIIYLGIALNAGNEELLLRRIKTFGVLCAVTTLVYYIAVFGKYGFHKETGFHGAQASLLAILLFMAGMERRKSLWILEAVTLLLVPVIFFMRSDVLTFLFALPTALALRLKSKKLRVLCWSASALIALPALFPPVAETVIQEIAKVSFVGEIIPSSMQDTDTLYWRGLQLTESINVLQAHPWFGQGIGSSFAFDNPSLGFLDLPFVDSGWGYLFQKMGLLGASAFLWFLISLLRSATRQSAVLAACLIATTVVSLFSRPTFFHFTTAPYLGVIAGLLLAKKDSKSKSMASQLP